MVVTFCGHRRLQDRNKVKAWLESTLAELIRQGADIIVAYITHSYGGAFQTFNFARRKKKKIISYQ